MIVTMIGSAPDVENQLRHAVAGLRTASPQSMPASMAELAPILDGNPLPDVMVLAPHNQWDAMPLVQILPVEQNVGVVVVASTADTDFAIAALRNGASDVIGADATLEEVKQAVSRAGQVAQRAAMIPAALDATDQPSLSDGERGEVIAVVSATGGVGKTTAAVNLAVGIAGIDPGSTVIVDAAEQFGGVADALDIVPRYKLSEIVNTADAIAAKSYLTRHMNKQVSSGLFIAPADEDPGAADFLVPAKVAETVEMLAHQFKVVVVDTGSGLSETNLEILTRADKVLLISDFTVHSLRATATYLRVLQALPRHTSLDTKLLLNKFDRGLGLTRANAEEVLAREADLVLKHMVDVGLASNQGRPPMLGRANSKPRKELAPLVSLFHEHAEPKRARKGGPRRGEEGQL